MDPAVLVENLRVLTVIKRIDLAATVVFLWDYFLTFGMEVEHIWASKWTIVKALFLIQRYIPFIDIMGLGMYISFGENISETRCTRLNYAWKSFSIVGVVTSEAVLCFRVWAVWNRKKSMAFLLAILFAGSWIPAIALLMVFVKTIKYVALPPPFLGCIVAAADESSSFEFFLAWDTVMLLLMLTATLRSYQRSGRTALFKIVYGEGIIYYVYLFLISLINIILNHNTSIPIPYRFIAVSMIRSLHTILPSRALLHLRSQIKQGYLSGLTSIEMESGSKAQAGGRKSRNFTGIKIALPAGAGSSTIATEA
ncbi:unnamed protein product [Cyclocybe aegerita]|uniref:DUF6533 domain-containing protein n=1 Tax=Cyclocybe aegerita TaxID=1973307 RepID=A0A8S0W5X8_CYCAE|nr:unnamed protein product [Cyclocybe aegerita]